MPVPMVTTHGQEPYTASDSLQWTEVLYAYMHVTTAIIAEIPHFSKIVTNKASTNTSMELYNYTM